MKTAALRRALLVLLVAATLGTGLELLLLDHTEGPWQWIPVVLTFGGVAIVGWHAAGKGAVSLRAFQGTMILFVLSGIVGLVLHYRGNVEFELDMHPHARGLALVWATLKGATPALAPATMMLLGLLGLITSTIVEE